MVDSEQAAYDYWLRTVRACIEAEHALSWVLRWYFGCGLPGSGPIAGSCPSSVSLGVHR